MEWILILVVPLLIWIWWDGLAARESANQIARQLCDEAQVQFLDGTVSVKKIRLRRSPRGHMVIYREFIFEFTLSGEQRYQGMISMLGKQVVLKRMEPYPLV